MDFASLAKTLNSNILLKLKKTIRELDLEYYISSSSIIPQKFIEVHSSNGSAEVTVEQRINPEFAIPNVLGQVTQLKTSLEMWSKIERTYSHQSMARILQLRQQLQTIKKGADSISDFVLNIETIGDAFMAAGETVSERDLLLSLMNGISQEYNSVVVLISSQHQTMVLEHTQFLFLIYELRIDQLNTTSQINVYATHFTSITILVLTASLEAMDLIV
ncbi:hypothetical protein ACOSQ2_027352 [Xanthoceras sorbifolium]